MDTWFPICITCGRRGQKIVWYQIAKSGRFGECLLCYRERCPYALELFNLVACSNPWCRNYDPKRFEELTTKQRNKVYKYISAKYAGRLP